MQTKKQSLIEVVVNIAVGFIVSLVMSFVIFPLCGVHMSPSQNVGSVIGFTVVSIIRQYIIRRFFNKKHNKVIV